MLFRKVIRVDAGIDSPLDCTKKIKAILAANLQFVGRYYRSKKSKWAPLTASEAQALSNAGLSLVALWEYASDGAKYFSYTAGVNDSTTAYQEAMLAGQPARTPIYFAVDYDAAPEEVSGCINDYFAGIAAGYQAIGRGNSAYDIGVYGSGLTCGWLLNHHSVTKTWLAVSSGWAGSKTFAKWNIKQGIGLSSLNFGNDSDIATPNYGAWQLHNSAPTA